VPRALLSVPQSEISNDRCISLSNFTVFIDISRCSSVMRNPHFRSGEKCESIVTAMIDGRLSSWSSVRLLTRYYFNVRSKADISQLNLPHSQLNLPHNLLV